MRIKLLVLPSLLLAIASGSLWAEDPADEPAPDPTAARVDALFAEWSKPDSPGCAIGVVRAGKIVVARGYGVADLEHDIPITPRTVFYIGSVGKQFTAYAVVRLAQQLGSFKTFVFPYSGYGAGGVFSTVEDLRWVSNYTKPRPGDERIVSQMVEPGRINGGQPITYASALMVDEYRGHKRVGHTGSLAGYRAYLGFFPDQDLGVIVLSNLASFPPGKAMELAELFLADKADILKPAKPGSTADPVGAAGKVSSAATEDPRPPRSKSAAALTAEDLRGYADTYSSPELGAVCKIVVDQDHLIVKLRERGCPVGGHGQGPVSWNRSH